MTAAVATPFTVDRVTAGAATLTLPRVRTVFLLARKPFPGTVLAPEDALVLWLDDLLASDSGLSRDDRDTLLHSLYSEIAYAGREIWSALEPYEAGDRPHQVVTVRLLILDQRYARLGPGNMLDLQTGSWIEKRRAPLRSLVYDLTKLFVQRRARMCLAEPGRKHRETPPAVTPPRPADG